jgi:hypothetical protein
LAAGWKNAKGDEAVERNRDTVRSRRREIWRLILINLKHTFCFHLLHFHLLHFGHNWLGRWSGWLNRHCKSSRREKSGMKKTITDLDNDKLNSPFFATGLAGALPKRDAKISVLASTFFSTLTATGGVMGAAGLTGARAIATRNHVSK